MLPGTIDIDGNALVISCQPHVAIKLRRVFAGVQRQKAGVFTISASPAQAHELKWFAERYPMEVTDRARARFGELVETQERKLEAIAAMDLPGYVPREFELAIPPREYQRIAAEMAIKTGQLLIADELGLGKQHPVDTKVMTPYGWREIGSLTIGDFVIGSDGQPTKVVGVFPQGVKPSYRVTFSDHSSVEAGGEHLWAFDYRKGGGKKWERIVVTTDQLIAGRTHPRLNSNGTRTSINLRTTPIHLPMLDAPVEFERCAPMPIDAYALGALIANGSLAHGTPQLVTNLLDWPEVERSLRGVELGKQRTYGNTVHVNILGMVKVIERLGLDVLSGQKRIPRCYMLASVLDRVSLFHGLMDGDGSISKTRNRVTYHSTSEGLVGDVQELIEGLGGIASIRKYVRDDGETNFAVRIRMPSTIPPFSISRKLSRLKPSNYPERTEPTRTFHSVEYVRDVESVCIAVAALDRLYATEHAILTHNTCSAIAALTGPGALPALVITMTHLQRQWMVELGRFAPKLRVHQIKKSEPYKFSATRVERVDGRRTVVQGEYMPDVLIVNYQKVHGWVETLAGAVRTAVLDETQEMRHSGSRKYDAVKAIADRCDMRIGLSATPIYNYGGEIHNVLGILAPDVLGTRKEFFDEWCGGTSDDQESAKKARVSDPAALGTYLREQGAMIRRTRKDVGRELPALTVVRHVVEADPDSINRSMESVAELAQRVLDRIGTNLERMQNAGELDYKLRQATGIAKARPVADFVRMLVESGERVVLFGWHHEVYRIWRDAFDMKGSAIPYAMYTGEESEAQKSASVAAFLDGRAKILIISVRAGAGLDGLQKVSRTVVVGELDWSPQVHSQGVGRVHRDGQTEPVMAYYLVAEEGSDPVIAETLGLKEAQSRGILNPEEATNEAQFVGRADDHIRKLAESIIARKKGSKS